MQLESFKLQQFPSAPRLQPVSDHMNAAAAEIGFSLCIYSVCTAVHNNRQTMALCLDAVMTGSAAGKRFCFVCRRARSTPAPSGPCWVKLTVKVVPSANYESRDGSTLHHYLGRRRPHRGLPGRQQSCARSCD